MSHRIFNKMTIREQWDSYRSLVVPANAPAIQIEECKRAFYAGAQSVVYIMMNIGESVSEEGGAMIMQGLCDETDAYARSIIGG